MGDDVLWAGVGAGRSAAGVCSGAARWRGLGRGLARSGWLGARCARCDRDRDGRRRGGGGRSGSRRLRGRRRGAREGWLRVGRGRRLDRLGGESGTRGGEGECGRDPGEAKTSLDPAQVTSPLSRASDDQCRATHRRRRCLAVNSPGEVFKRGRRTYLTGRERSSRNPPLPAGLHLSNPAGAKGLEPSTPGSGNPCGLTRPLSMRFNCLRTTRVPEDRCGGGAESAPPRAAIPVRLGRVVRMVLQAVRESAWGGGRGSGGRDAGLAFQSAERIRYQVLGVRVTRLSSKGLSAQADVTIRNRTCRPGPAWTRSRSDSRSSGQVARGVSPSHSRSCPAARPAVLVLPA